MAKRRSYLMHRKQRAVLTDMLPFEVPPTFSNRGYYRFLRQYFVDIENGYLRWVSDSDAVDLTICLIFGIVSKSAINSEKVVEWGKTKTRKSISLKHCEMVTIPFSFTVAHKLDGRSLSVVHPRNQVAVANFYANHSALIIYNTSKSSFSIRKPSSVARYAYFKDKLHEQKVDRHGSGIEEDDREYEQLGSYFVYKAYRNIHRFFESYRYHQAEKKYGAMLQLDVSKCFDSIYTHSLAWSILGKEQAKFSLDQSKKSFAGRFDSLMCSLNHGETNGIVIGPEFSRVFAEIVLQTVDIETQKALLQYGLEHKVHYEAFRYVDDYFVFFNSHESITPITQALQAALRQKKLALNTEKLKQYAKPIITEITIAKESISALLNEEIEPDTEEMATPEGMEAAPLALVCSVNSRRLIVRYKSAIRAANVEYADLLNYTFSIVENKLDKLLKAYTACSKSIRDQRRLVRAILALMEFAFFTYSASPKTNHTIRVCRLIATSVRFLHYYQIPYDLKHLVFKYVHDNVMQQLNKNAVTPHREVESLYLLISLSQIGNQYWLPEASLAKYLAIKLGSDNNTYERPAYLSHFSVTVLLSYIKKKKRYQKLREFLESHIVKKLADRKAQCAKDAESLLLFMDLIICPYVADDTKLAIAKVFEVDATSLAAIQSVADSWFTSWGDQFDLARELDAKRSVEVY